MRVINIIAHIFDNSSHQEIKIRWSAVSITNVYGSIRENVIRNVVNPCKLMKAVPPITYNVTKTQQETPVGDGLFLSLPHSFPLGENLGHLDFQPAISAQRAMCSSVSNHLHFRRTAGPAQAKMSWALGALGIWLVAPLNPWSQDPPKPILPVVCQVRRELLGCDQWHLGEVAIFVRKS